jgi:hypothetical protein
MITADPEQRASAENVLILASSWCKTAASGRIWEATNPP